MCSVYDKGTQEPVAIHNMTSTQELVIIYNTEDIRLRLNNFVVYYFLL